MKSAIVLFKPLGSSRTGVLPCCLVITALLVSGCDRVNANARVGASSSAAASSVAEPRSGATGSVASGSAAGSAVAQAVHQGPKPKRCRLDEVGGILFEIALEGDLAVRSATREALAVRAAQLNPNCMSRVRETPRGVNVEVFDLRALATNTPRALTDPGVVWVAPWSADVPKPDELVKRPADAVVVEVVSAAVSNDDAAGELPSIVIKFAPASTAAFSELSSRHIGTKLAIGYDDRVLAAPQIMERIDGGEIRITLGHSQLAASTPGQGTVQRTKRLAKQLARPPLPSAARLLNINQVGPTKPRKRQ